MVTFAHGRREIRLLARDPLLAFLVVLLLSLPGPLRGLSPALGAREEPPERRRDLSPSGTTPAFSPSNISARPYGTASSRVSPRRRPAWRWATRRPSPSPGHPSGGRKPSTLSSSCPSSPRPSRAPSPSSCSSAPTASSPGDCWAYGTTTSTASRECFSPRSSPSPPWPTSP